MNAEDSDSGLVFLKIRFTPTEGFLQYSLLSDIFVVIGRRSLFRFRCLGDLSDHPGGVAGDHQMPFRKTLGDDAPRTDDGIIPKGHPR
jgi:hypothetical protein